MAYQVLRTAAVALIPLVGLMAWWGREPGELRQPTAANVSLSAAPAMTDAFALAAMIDGEPVTMEDLRSYIGVVRAPDYRPATLGEARRLLRGLLRIRVLEGEARRRAGGADAEALGETLNALRTEVGGSVGLSAGDVARYMQRQARNVPGTASPLDGADQIPGRLAARRAELQRRELLDRLLATREVHVDEAALVSLVDVRSQDDVGAQLPPGFRATP